MTKIKKDIVTIQIEPRLAIEMCLIESGVDESLVEKVLTIYDQALKEIIPMVEKEEKKKAWEQIEELFEAGAVLSKDNPRDMG